MIRLVQLLWFLLLLTGCSEKLSVHSDGELDLNFSTYHTYAWPVATEEELKRNPLAYAEFRNENIRHAIEQQLEARGYHHTDSVADLTIHYHLVVEDKKLFIYDNTVNETYSPSWYPREHFTFHYEEGSFIIDVIETQTNHIIWRGWVEKIIEQYPFQLSQKEINRDVQKIFEKFPLKPLPVKNNIPIQTNPHARHTVSYSN